MSFQVRAVDVFVYVFYVCVCVCICAYVFVCVYVVVIVGLKALDDVARGFCMRLLMPVMTSKLFHRYHNVMEVLLSWEVLKYAAFFLRHHSARSILYGSVW